MKTQDIKTRTTETPPSPVHTKINRWLSVTGALIMVALLVGVSAVVFAQLDTHRLNHTAAQPGTTITAKPPASGHWEQVLKGYSLTSVVAAQSNPAVLYACATKSSPGSSGSGATTYTILRSTDFGNSWQDVANKEGLSINCQLAVNPVDSNELFALGTANPNNISSDILKHTTDGGETWETIQPTLKGVVRNGLLASRFMHISFAGKRLFALQWAPQQFIPENNQNAVSLSGLLPSLVTSVDGGHTWIRIENQLQSTWQGVRDYIVDPTNSNTIYEFLGETGLPIVPEPGIQPGGGVQPAFKLAVDLYKTTDGGATWYLVLHNVPFGSQLQLAQGDPQTIYVGGSSSILGPAERPLPNFGLFQLQMSSDGGAHWRQIATPPAIYGPQNWFVSTNGQVYLTPMRYGGPSTPGVGMVPTQVIQYYDPSSDKWGEVARTLTPGTLLAVTPVDAHGGAVLWLLGATGAEQALYRYVV